MIKLKSIIRCTVAMGISAMILTACGGPKNFIIPRAVSSADAISLKDLNLTRNDYDVLSTISESASVKCTFKKNEIQITALDDNFSYKFKFDAKTGWKLDSFSGVATLGYFVSDMNETMSSIPNPEEFSRRVASARLINAVKDFDADGIIEPITTTMVSQESKNTVIFKTKISAKLVKLKTNN